MRYVNSAKGVEMALREVQVQMGIWTSLFSYSRFESLYLQFIAIHII